MQKPPNIVGVLSGESVADRALELLLQSIGYRTRFLVEPHLDEIGELLEGVQLLILAPTVSRKFREDFLHSAEYASAMAGKPVLELVTSSDSPQPLAQGRILWPCRIEELQREIEAALLVGSGLNKSSSEKSAPDSTRHGPEAAANSGAA